MLKRTVLTALSLMLIVAVMAATGSTEVVPDAIWADGQLYGTVLTPTELPDRGPKDGLYNFTNMPGQRAVSESKPGDADYNGGRWQVYLVEVVDFDALDHELTSWEEVEMYIDEGVLEVTGMGPSFVCPLVGK